MNGAFNSLIEKVKVFKNYDSCSDKKGEVLPLRDAMMNVNNSQLFKLRGV